MAMTSPAKLLRQPAENKWSLAQCLEHLNSYGRYYLLEIEKAIETAKQKVGLQNQVSHLVGLEIILLS